MIHTGLHRLVLLATLLQSLSNCVAANFGTLIPVRGTAGDIALDERRSRLYITNLAANRIDVLNTQDRAFAPGIQLSRPPSAVALSPDNRFLVVGHYDNFSENSTKGSVTIVDLDAGLRQEFTTEYPVLGVSFGAGALALVVTTRNAFLVEPLTMNVSPIRILNLTSTQLPVPFATFPQKITNASLNVSGDGQTIVGVADSTAGTLVFRYRVGTSTLSLSVGTFTPALGPRAVSVNQNASRILVGWALFDDENQLLSQIPYPLGDYRLGGHLFDFTRDVIYAHIPASATEAPVLHLLDTDNLTVRERIQLPQIIAGRSVISSDKETVYALSDNGILILPVGRLSREPRVQTVQRDVLFLGDACNRRVISQFLDVVDPNGQNVDFTLSLPANTAGIRLSASSGTTPTRIRIDVDPTAYQQAKGTTSIPLTITSSAAVNVPEPVRLLINTRDVNQRGRIVNIAGKLVDILADPLRSRVYVLRQDRNEVLVYDSSAVRQIAALRTGNTPVSMAITEDSRHLMVGNDNSQYISVFDLETLLPAPPVWTPGVYVRSLAVGRGGIWATARRADGKPPTLFSIDFVNRVATAPSSLGIYQNIVAPTSILSASPSLNYILLAMVDGTVALWEASSNRWIGSRKDQAGLGGAIATLNDNLFAIGSNFYDESLYPVASSASSSTPSGIGLLGGSGVRSSAGLPTSAGILERIDLAGRTGRNGTLIVESPHTATTLLTPRIGQIGQTILPFTRTLAVASDQSSIFLISQSGLSVIAPNFDAAMTNPIVSSVSNSADFGPLVASGGLITINGSGLALNPSVADALPLPSTLGDVCVTVNNMALPLFRVSSTSVAAQLPFDVQGSSTMVIRNSGGISDAFRFNVESGAPAIFRTGTAGGETGLPVVIRDKNNEIMNFTNPIHPKESISIILTGLGRTSPSAPLGDAAPSNPLALVISQPEVSIGNTVLQLDFAGLVPGQVGVYRISVTVPDGIKDALEAPLTIRQGSNSTAVPVRVVTP